MNDHLTFGNPLKKIRTNQYVSSEFQLACYLSGDAKDRPSRISCCSLDHDSDSGLGRLW
jgi:hypothetical protein